MTDKKTRLRPIKSDGKMSPAAAAAAVWEEQNLPGFEKNCPLARTKWEKLKLTKNTDNIFLNVLH